MVISSKPIIVVTGANAGVGFGICQRLLFQLSQAYPTDALPQAFAPDTQTTEIPTTYNGLTLIMACRSEKRAAEARAKLLRLFNAHVELLRKSPNYDGHAHKFRENVDIQFHYLDLASIASVFRFAEELSQRYPYISHLICNAGVNSFKCLHWPTVFQQFFTDPVGAVTHPRFNLQHKGELSIDGLGWVWQCNTFSHYALFRELQPLLTASPTEARVIWSSSLEALPCFYDPEDWQLKNTDHSYEGSKYQIDLIATALEQQSIQEVAPDSKRIRHFISQPGLCNTQVVPVGMILDFIKVILFYLARLFGSVNHNIEPFKSAIATVHLVLAPLCFITPLMGSRSPAPANETNSDVLGTHPIRFGSQTERWGDEHVGLTEVAEWESHEEESEALLARCDLLLRSLRVSERVTMDFETASEHM